MRAVRKEYSFFTTALASWTPDDTHSRGRQVDVGQHVMVRRYRDGGPIWVKGRVVKKQGDLTFMVEIEDGVVWKQHIDQMLHADASQCDGESSEFVNL